MILTLLLLLAQMVYGAGLVLLYGYVRTRSFPCPPQASFLQVQVLFLVLAFGTTAHQFYGGSASDGVAEVLSIVWSALALVAEAALIRGLLLAAFLWPIRSLPRRRRRWIDATFWLALGNGGIRMVLVGVSPDRGPVEDAALALAGAVLLVSCLLGYRRLFHPLLSEMVRWIWVPSLLFGLGWLWVLAARFLGWEWGEEGRTIAHALGFLSLGEFVGRLGIRFLEIQRNEDRLSRPHLWREDIGAGLSRREREVCELILKGLVIKEAAAHLGISTNTARNHLARVYQKLGVTTRAELVHRFHHRIEPSVGLGPGNLEMRSIG